MTGGLKENLYWINVSEVDKRRKTCSIEKAADVLLRALYMRTVGGGVRLPLKVGVAKFFPYFIISRSSLSMCAHVPLCMHVNAWCMWMHSCPLGHILKFIFYGRVIGRMQLKECQGGLVCNTNVSLVNIVCSQLAEYRPFQFYW